MITKTLTFQAETRGIAGTATVDALFATDELLQRFITHMAQYGFRVQQREPETPSTGRLTETVPIPRCPACNSITTTSQLITVGVCYGCMDDFPALPSAETPEQEKEPTE